MKKRQRYMFEESAEDLPLFSNTPQRGEVGRFEVPARSVPGRQEVLLEKEIEPQFDAFILVQLLPDIQRVDTAIYPYAVITSNGTPTSTGNDARYWCIFIPVLPLEHQPAEGRVYLSEIAKVSEVLTASDLRKIKEQAR